LRWEKQPLLQRFRAKPLYPCQTLRRGLSGILVFVNFGCAIGIISPRYSTLTDNGMWNRADS